jgi:hypothetical protein
LDFQGKKTFTFDGKMKIGERVSRKSIGNKLARIEAE